MNRRGLVSKFLCALALNVFLDFARAWLQRKGLQMGRLFPECTRVVAAVTLETIAISNFFTCPPA